MCRPKERRALPGCRLSAALFEAQSAWKELPVVGSYGRMLDPTQSAGREKSNRVRVLIWEGVVDLISPHAPLTYPDGSEDRYNFLRPLIGYGPEAMYVAYNRFYPPELATVEARNASPDRAHNETFDALVITGLAGFLAWQALYIAVFYYGFSFLGVVRSKRDRSVLFACWIGGGLLGALLSFTAVEPIYLGVAVPTGTVLGLILYLFYYALLARPSVQATAADSATAAPFLVDRLLVNALLAAVLAHYVEIHFGIAISATRLHFFVYVALLLVVVYKLPQLRAAGAAQRAEQSADNKGGQRALNRERLDEPPWVGIWPWAFLLALMIGVLGFEFMNYALPPDKVIQTGADLAAGDIFGQSLFLNAQQGFVDSPFIYLMIVLSWFLSVLVVLSEAVRYREHHLSLPKLSPVKKSRSQMAAALFLLLGLAGVAQRVVGPAAGGARVALGQSLGLLGAMVALGVAVQLLRAPENGRFAAIAAALGGLASLFAAGRRRKLGGGDWAWPGLSADRISFVGWAAAAVCRSPTGAGCALFRHWDGLHVCACRPVT